MIDGNAAIPQMNFADGKWMHGNTPAKLAKVITNGVPGTAMMSFKERFSDPEILGLAKYVMAFDKTHKTSAAPAKKPAPSRAARRRTVAAGGPGSTGARRDPRPLSPDEP